MKANVTRNVLNDTSTMQPLHQGLSEPGGRGCGENVRARGTRQLLLVNAL